MNAFDKVIGYKATKRELLQLCDMLRNREIYEEMGARLPHGLHHDAGFLPRLGSRRCPACKAPF